MGGRPGFSPVPMYGCDARFDTWQNTGTGEARNSLGSDTFAAWAFSTVVPSDHVMPLPRVLVEAFVFFLFSFFFFFLLNNF